MTTTAAPVAAAALEDRLGYRFDDPALLEQALTHRSWCAENAGSQSNERLELLGDAVLNLVVVHQLYERYPQLAEGSLAPARASLVSAASLAEVGRSTCLGKALRLGRGEARDGGSDKPSLLADAVEAVLGAVYLDGGLAEAEALVQRLLGDRMAAEAKAPGHADFKTRLLELATRLGLQRPSFDVTSAGQSHRPTFHAEVHAGDARGTGEGHTKKEAEQHAAEVAYSALVAQGAR